MIFSHVKTWRVDAGEVGLVVCCMGTGDKLEIRLAEAGPICWVIDWTSPSTGDRAMKSGTEVYIGQFSTAATIYL